MACCGSCDTHHILLICYQEEPISALLSDTSSAHQYAMPVRPLQPNVSHFSVLGDPAGRTVVKSRRQSPSSHCSSRCWRVSAAPLLADTLPSWQANETAGNDQVCAQCWVCKDARYRWRQAASENLSVLHAQTCRRCVGAGRHMLLLKPNRIMRETF